MAKPVNVHLRAVQRSRNGRPARRTGAGAALLSIGATTGRRSLGFFRSIRAALAEILGLAVVLALSIVLAHVMLVLVFPV